ncbi:hypothetical protein [Frankia sp. R43]|uniref:hypothetical protein n=1 Tax=Frankia sp. R43 TaxID=269536 RepID=UPI000B2F1970|nr:hypothetical protein [Frankia sp. R43]
MERTYTCYPNGHQPADFPTEGEAIAYGRETGAEAFEVRDENDVQTFLEIPGQKWV